MNEYNKSSAHEISVTSFTNPMQCKREKLERVKHPSIMTHEHSEVRIGRFEIDYWKICMVSDL